MKPCLGDYAEEVSVVIPLHNAERFIGETLRSVQKQTYSHYEVLVVDNCSTDRGPEIVKHLAETDTRFKLLTEKRAGVSYARNFGIHAARNEWIAILDADDLWMAEKLESHLAFILDFEQRTGRKISASGTFGFHIGEKGVDVGVAETHCKTIEEYEVRLRDAKLIYLLNSSVMMRKSAFLASGGYNTNYIAGEDIDLYFRMAEQGVVINYPEHLFRYRVHDKSASTTHFITQQINTLLILHNIKMRRTGHSEKNYQEFRRLLDSEPLKERLRRSLRWRSQHKYRIAGAALANRNYLKGCSCLIYAMLLDPFVVWERLSIQVIPFYKLLWGRYQATK